jgi:hypothetical protein
MKQKRTEERDNSNMMSINFEDESTWKNRNRTKQNLKCLQMRNARLSHTPSSHPQSSDNEGIGRHKANAGQTDKTPKACLKKPAIYSRCTELKVGTLDLGNQGTNRLYGQQNNQLLEQPVLLLSSKNRLSDLLPPPPTSPLHKRWENIPLRK